MSENLENRISSEQAKDAIFKMHNVQSSASEIDGSVNLAHPSLNSFLNQINNKNRSMSIFVNSDSTGNEFNEWVYFFGEYLAEAYPEYTVRYRIWNDNTNEYLVPTNINTGTTSYFIDIWNFAVGGSMPIHCLNINKKEKALLQITNNTIYPDASTTIDLCIINHGHNVWNAPRDWDNVLRYAIFTEEFINIHPFASFMMIRQNPNRDDNNNSKRIQFAVDWANRKNICIADVWSKFIGLNKHSSLYADNVHPSTGLGTKENPTGTRLFLNSVKEQLQKKYNFYSSSFSSILNNYGKSYCLNSNLLHTIDPTKPDNFVLNGCTSEKDIVDFVNFNKGYSTKIIAIGGIAPYIDYTVPENLFKQLKGKFLTASVFLKSDIETSSMTYCRIAFITNTDTKTDSHIFPLNGDWHWRFNSIQVKSSDSYLRLRIYIDSSNSVAVGKSINIDKLIICEGSLPFGNAM